ncbi:MAG TPA: ADOP family duplicated permease [Thermoanaerobaculia bacterium]|nr:ADOP family duplicated permease [Thermoanaerobaculia bacterium]
MLSRLLASLRMIVDRLGFERSLDRELRDHLESRQADLVAAGVEPAEARRRARHEFGSVEAVKEECREATGVAWLHALGRDLRYGLRQLRRNPVFTTVALATLALTIGANTALYSLVDAALFRPLPYPEPERLGQVVRTVVDGGETMPSVDGRTWEAVRDAGKGLQVAAFSDWTTGVNLVAGGAASHVEQQKVSAGFFAALGAPPALGRGFSAEEDVPGGAAVTVLSHDLWQGSFAGDRRVLGDRVLLRGEPYEVIGVMPPGFRSTAAADLWTPLRPSTDGEGSGTNYAILARLDDGTSWPEAKNRLAGVGRTLLAENLDGATELGIAPLQDAQSQHVRRPLLLLWGAVIAVLLVGCLNLASLLLSRTAARGHEMAVRQALGGGRGPLLRQLLVEGMVLAACGGVLGILVGSLLLPLLLRFAAPLGYDLDATIDLRVMTTMGILSLATVLVFGLYPAWKLSRFSVREVIADSGRTVAGGSRHWPRRLLVVAEVALSVVLLVTGTLLARSLSHLQQVDPGFEPAGLVAATVSLQDARYDTAAEIEQLFRQSLERIDAAPGVAAAAVSLSAPYERPLNTPFVKVGDPGERQLTNLVYVAGDFVETLGLPLVAGRDLRPTDRRGAPRVALVNRTFGERYFEDGPVVGQRIAAADAEWEIVGVVGDVVQRTSFGDGEPVSHPPVVYVAAGQMPDAYVALVHGWFAPSWLVRTAGGTGAATEAVRDGLRATDPTLPISRLAEVSEVADGSLVEQRFQAWLMACLALLALVLAGVGLAGLVASGVSERRRELGIRLTLGATRGQALASAVLPGLAVAAAGLAAGALAAPLAVGLLRGLLWGISASEPQTVAVVALALLAVAGTASLLPALRTVSIDPAATLRRE